MVPRVSLAVKPMVTVSVGLARAVSFELLLIMLTAVNYDLNRKLSQDVMGAEGYITKPFESQALMSMIAEALNGN